MVITAGFKELGGAGVNRTGLADGPGAAVSASSGPTAWASSTPTARSLPQRLLRPADAPARQHRPGFPKRRGGGGGPGIRPGRGNRRPLQFVSVGNKADLNENDFLAYLKDDPQTDVILFYLEDLAETAGGSSNWPR